MQLREVALRRVFVDFSIEKEGRQKVRDKAVFGEVGAEVPTLGSFHVKLG